MNRLSVIRVANGLTLLAGCVFLLLLVVLQQQNIGEPWMRAAGLAGGILGFGALRAHLHKAERREELLGPPQDRSILAELHPAPAFSDAKDHARFLRAL